MKKKVEPAYTWDQAVDTVEEGLVVTLLDEMFQLDEALGRNPTESDINQHRVLVERVKDAIVAVRAQSQHPEFFPKQDHLLDIAFWAMLTINNRLLDGMRRRG